MVSKIFKMVSAGFLPKNGLPNRGGENGVFLSKNCLTVFSSKARLFFS